MHAPTALVAFDCSFLTINCNSKASSEVHLLPAELHGSTAAAPRLVQRRVAGLEYFVEHNAGQLYILSNARGAGNYALYRWVVQQRRTRSDMQQLEMIAAYHVSS